MPTPKVAPPIPSCQSKLYVVIIHAQNAEIGIEQHLSEKSPMIEPPAQLWGTARVGKFAGRARPRGRGGVRTVSPSIDRHR